jgi:hypothetical protein
MIWGMAHRFFPLLLRERLTRWYIIFDSPDHQPLVDLIIVVHDPH